VLAGANPRAKNGEGTTPLHYAAYRGHTGIVSLLSERKAPVDMANEKGQTALHNAALGASLSLQFIYSYMRSALIIIITSQGDKGRPRHI
jgi:ankyrin repeat protein